MCSETETLSTPTLCFFLQKAAVKDMLVFVTTSEDALDVYKTLRETLQTAGLQLRSNVPPQAPGLGSAALQQVRHSLSVSVVLVGRMMENIGGR